MPKATLHMLHTCPFCWKVRGLIEFLKLDVDYPLPIVKHENAREKALKAFKSI